MSTSTPVAFSADLIHSDRIVAITCGSCGVVFGLGQTFIDIRQDDHRTWYCPNGHPRFYPADNKAERLAKENERLKTQNRIARESERFHREQAAHERRSAAAVRGHLTRLRKRIAAGVCPCCNRSFDNVRCHIEGQHPDWVTEHAAALS